MQCIIMGVIVAERGKDTMEFLLANIVVVIGGAVIGILAQFLIIKYAVKAALRERDNGKY